MLILATIGAKPLNGKLYQLKIERPKMGLKMRNWEYGNFE